MFGLLVPSIRLLCSSKFIIISYKYRTWHGKAVILKGHYSMYSLGHDHEMILKRTKLKEIVVKSFNT